MFKTKKTTPVQATQTNKVLKSYAVETHDQLCDFVNEKKINPHTILNGKNAYVVFYYE